MRQTATVPCVLPQVLCWVLLCCTVRLSALRVAFGSCNKGNEDQPLWDQIMKRSPEAWIWGGDVIYADKRVVPNVWDLLGGLFFNRLGPGERTAYKPPSLDEHQAAFHEQMAHPAYQAFLASGIPVYGVWDDHDAGLNDADRWHYEFSWGMERQKLLLDFLGVSADDPRRSRRGVYASHWLADGVKLVLLDTRTFRDPWPWHPTDGAAGKADVLGDEQWTWLGRELGDTRATAFLVVSGFQVLPLVSVAPKHETWTHHAPSRRRLLSLVARAAASVVLLSGDVHFAEISEERCRLGSELDFTLAEFTSSGMTHAWGGEPQNWPTSPLAPKIFCFAWHWWDTLGRWFGVHAHRVAAYSGLNYGELELTHGALIARARGLGGAVAFERNWSLASLPGGVQRGRRAAELIDAGHALVCEAVNRVEGVKSHAIGENLRLTLAHVLFYTPFIIGLVLPLVLGVWVPWYVTLQYLGCRRRYPTKRE